MLVLHQFLYVLSILRCTFYAFSGTNLLTRCHSASSCFLLILVSEKLHRKYSRNWTKQIAKFLISRDEDGVRRRVEGGHRVATPPLGVARPGPAPRNGVGLLASADLALPRIYSPSWENPGDPSIIPRKVPSRPSLPTLVRGTEVSVPTPCRDGELPLEPSPSTPPPSSSLLLTPMMRRE